VTLLVAGGYDRAKETVKADIEMLRLMAANVHGKTVSLLPPHPTAGRAHAEPLSVREREVMSWTSEGKTAWEIGMILDISKPTVDFHIQRVVSKLDASNKCHAAALLATEAAHQLEGFIPGLPSQERPLS
jgi:DNA-binding CsgD family transcriptional regulator